MSKAGGHTFCSRVHTEANGGNTANLDVAPTLSWACGCVCDLQDIRDHLSRNKGFVKPLIIRVQPRAKSDDVFIEWRDSLGGAHSSVLDLASLNSQTLTPPASTASHHWAVADPFADLPEITEEMPIPKLPPDNTCDYYKFTPFFSVSLDDLKKCYAREAQEELKSRIHKDWQRSILKGPYCEFKGSLELKWEENMLMGRIDGGFVCPDCHKKWEEVE